MSRRSNEPIFWALFGAGGMLAALIGPALILITGIAVPLGLLGPDALRYDNAHALAQHWLGKGVLFGVVSLFLWHAGHRIFHSLHDFGIHAGSFARALCYGLPATATVIIAAALLSIGF
ncbi:fumarate reductase subunit FrdD [Niveibacterium umoris]|uniref:Fumarate reductase subunit D n=1 Tax=Niveibacterium umoris TaxID=1193620 RepID=A0A840BFN8_9RHOO|nr:fumarate reductase subunit FrdD [Niveibacterium umoris]MBB4011840.1 fumarate reductase subunit D [Niveibacterium umoris]